MEGTNQQQATQTRTLVRGLDESQREAFFAARTALGSYKQSQKAMEKVARSVVELRLTFHKGEQPDYGGESAKYRTLVTALYEQIIPDDEERTLFKSAIRYWIRKEIARRVDDGEIDPKALGERFTAASQAGERLATPEERAQIASDEPLQRDVENGNHNNRMEQILADLSPRTAIREAGNALAARVDVVGVIPSIKAVNVGLDAVITQMGAGGVANTKALERAVAALVTRTLEIADKAGVNVLEQVVKHDATAA